MHEENVRLLFEPKLKGASLFLFLRSWVFLFSLVYD